MHAARLQEMIYGKTFDWSRLDEEEREALDKALNSKGGEVLVALLIGRWRHNSLRLPVNLGVDIFGNGVQKGRHLEARDIIEKVLTWKGEYRRKDEKTNGTDTP